MIPTLVKKLIYLDYPNICRAVSFISQFMGSPTQEHMQDLMRILIYEAKS